MARGRGRPGTTGAAEPHGRWRAAANVRRRRVGLGGRGGTTGAANSARRGAHRAGVNHRRRGAGRDEPPVGARRARAGNRRGWGRVSARGPAGSGRRVSLSITGRGDIRRFSRRAKWNATTGKFCDSDPLTAACSSNEGRHFARRRRLFDTTAENREAAIFAHARGPVRRRPRELRFARVDATDVQPRPVHGVGDGALTAARGSCRLQDAGFSDRRPRHEPARGYRDDGWPCASATPPSRLRPRPPPRTRHQVHGAEQPRQLRGRALLQPDCTGSAGEFEQRHGHLHCRVAHCTTSDLSPVAAWSRPGGSGRGGTLAFHEHRDRRGTRANPSATGSGPSPEDCPGRIPRRADGRGRAVDGDAYVQATPPAASGPTARSFRTRVGAHGGRAQLAMTPVPGAAPQIYVRDDAVVKEIQEAAEGKGRASITRRSAVCRARVRPTRTTSSTGRTRSSGHSGVHRTHMVDVHPLCDEHHDCNSSMRIPWQTDTYAPKYNSCESGRRLEARRLERRASAT